MVMNIEPPRPSTPLAAHHLLLLSTLLLASLASAQTDAALAAATPGASASVSTGAATNPAANLAPATSSGETRPAPPTDLEQAFTTANLAEDEDQDLPQALESYRGIVRDYDARRRRVAEALFRFGETARKLQRTDEARSAYERILSEFGRYEDLATRSRERLDAMGEASAEAGSSTPAQRMSEELMRRYGLAPSGPEPFSAGTGPRAEQTAPAPARGPYQMSPELMRRYGLIPKTAATNSDGSIPAEARNTGDAAPTTYIMSPELMKRYGLDQVRPPSPARSGSTPGTAVASTAAAPGQVDPRQQELAALRAEAIRLTMEVHKAKRQLRVLGLHPDPRRIPAYLVEDPRLNQMLEALEKAEDDLQIAGDTGGATGEQLDHLRERRSAIEKRVHSYLQNALVPRLESAVKVLEEDLLGIRGEIDALEDRLRTPSR